MRSLFLGFLALVAVIFLLLTRWYFPSKKALQDV